MIKNNKINQVIDSYKKVKSINLFISSNFASPLFTKKLQCFLEIHASPKLLSKGTDSLISSQTFF